MTNFQMPLGSGFGARSTAHDVVAGLSLSGKLAVVTGGHSGLGLETTRALTETGATVRLGARSIARAREAVAGIAAVEVDELDLADLGSIRAFAHRLIASQRPVDIVINGAGICACPETRVAAGWEAQFAVNHLGHFVLINDIWPALTARGARVVAVSSDAHHGSSMRWDDVMFNRGYDKWRAYCQSKTANALFARHLDTLGRDVGVRAFSAHPGEILTPLLRHLPKEEMVAAGWIDEGGNLANPTFKTPQQGAATQVWAATSPRLQGKGGVYCRNCDIAPLAREGEFVGVREYAVDPEQAARLWALSARLTGVNVFATERQP